MIVCSCNALSEARIKAALANPQNPPRRVLEVHHRLGCRPQCGCCARAILGLIRESQGCASAPEACIEANSIQNERIQDDQAA
jgi:bacterioferritin-associated ferredoxin